MWFSVAVAVLLQLILVPEIALRLSGQSAL